MKRPKILSLIAAILILLGSFACVLPLARAAALRVAGNVDEARVSTEAASGNDWMLNGQDFGERHFSPLKQITGKNVSKLGLAWSLDIDSAMGMAGGPTEGERG